ncbi:MAG TPA: hypothetical protein VM889_12975 [Candidatus Thermoplasmatota archaeon]|nr:hypothetical protein [Candidatus Thermoplasmatota archaeon]
MAHLDPATWLMLAAAVAALAVAPGVYAASPRATVNRLLALYLVLVGANFVANRIPVFFEGLTQLTYNATVYEHATNFAVPFAYLLFMGAALDTPLARPLRHRVARLLLLAGIAAAFVVVVGFHETYFEMTYFPEIGESYPIAPAWAHEVQSPLWMAVGVFGLLASLHARHRAPRGSLARRRANGYALAFGVQDVGFVVVPSLHVLGVHNDLGWGLALLLSVGLLARALLRDQLFDFDLKLKWTLKQSTTAAIFVGVFFVVSETAQEIFQESVGPYLGIAAAGLLVFAMAPLQRFTERLADRAMPSVQPTPAYIAYKKLEVYRAAAESAMETGGVDARERAALERLRDKLGIAPQDAAAVDAEVLEGTHAARPAQRDLLV